MNRHRFLFAYDISDDKRRTKVFKLLSSYGSHTQFSVFFCELSDTDLIHLKGKLSTHIHSQEDQVLIVDLGVADRDVEDFIFTVGTDYEEPIRTRVV